MHRTIIRFQTGSCSVRDFDLDHLDSRYRPRRLPTAPMEDDRENSSTKDQSLIPGPCLPPDSFTLLETALHLPEEAGTDSKPLLSQTDVFRALEVVERDSLAIAQSYTSLFDSLRLALSEATRSSVDHMHCFNDAAGRLQESVLDVATKGNRYINSCLRLNEEMKGVDSLASQLKVLRRNVDALDSAVNKLFRFP